MITSVLPLSPLQAGMLYHAMADEATLDVYTMQSSYRFDRDLNPAALRAACESLLDRHPTLAAGFTARAQGAPVAFLTDETHLLWREVHLPARDTGDQLARLQRAERTTRFELDKPPLIRFVLAHTGPGTGVLVVTNHHILYDGWSDALVVTELLQHYVAGGRDTTLAEPASFRDYLRWLTRQPQDAAEPWRDHLDGLRSGTLVAPEADLRSTSLPEVSERPLPPALTDRVAALARDCAVTVNTVYTALWGLVLRELTGSDDVVMGMTVSGRPAELPQVDDMIGMFLNTVPTRVPVRPSATVRQWLRDCQDHASSLITAHHVPLAEIQQLAGVGALFDTLYVMRNTPMSETELDELSTAAGLGELDGGDATHYPLTFVVHPGAATTLMISYRSDSFSATTVDQLLDFAVAQLAALCDAPDAALGTVLAAGRREITANPALPQHPGELRGPHVELPEHSLVESLSHQVRTRPELPALHDPSGTWTFFELGAAVVALAKTLRAKGVQPGDLVAIDLPRSADYVAAIFGVLAARAAYVPLDRSQPEQRRLQILASAAPTLTVDQDLWDTVLADARRTRCASAALADQMAASVAGYTHGDLAYVMYTSGSTGQPKGVATLHRGLVNMACNHEREIFAPALRTVAGDQAVVAHTVSFAFDMSWEELLWLVIGHEVHIFDEQQRRDPDGMIEHIRRHAVDVINVTPTVCSALLTAGLLEGHCPSLVLLGGESVGPATWSALREHPNTLGYNLYGPTEYTINTLGGGTTESATPIVGRPISNTVVQLLDSALVPVEPGRRGELYVRGAGTALGYHGDPAATAAAFVAGPDGTRWYRTGDIARLNDDGLIEFCGRVDDQVKIRGMRVEPEEIACTLGGHPSVAECVVRVVASDRGGQRLVAYVVPAGAQPAPDGGADGGAQRADGADRAAELLAWAREHLPGPMVPSAIVELEAMPLTSQGKLATRELPVPAEAEPSTDPPRDETERVLAEAFAAVLGVPACGRDDDFFALGGHSLSAMALVGALRSQLGRRVRISTLMQAPTPAALAAALRGTTGERLTGLLTLRGEAALGAGGGRHVPLVCLSPASGLGWSYRTLLGHIGSRPVAAVQAPETHDAETLGEYAAELAREIAAAYAGPVHLLGWSFGGMVAHQLAALLGDAAASLAIIDAVPTAPPTDAGSTEADFLQEAFDFLLRAPGRERPEWLTAPYALDAVVEFLALGDDVWSGLTREQVEQVARNYTWASALMVTAQPGQVGAPVFLATADASELPGAGPSPSAALWQPYTQHPVEAVAVAAEHNDMLTPLAVGQWGPAYHRFLTTHDASTRRTEPGQDVVDLRVTPSPTSQHHSERMTP